MNPEHVGLNNKTINTVRGKNVFTTAATEPTSYKY